MPSLPMALLTKRQHNDMDDDDDDLVDNGSWYFSNEATAIKYGILFGILFLGAAVIFGSWFHARQRIKKGIAPLRYHRWLVPRSQRARWEPHLAQPEQNFSFYQQQQQQQQESGYAMQPVQPPPPAYNPDFPQPPVYPGATSGPSKNEADPFRDPPPEAGAAVGSSSSSSSSNLNGTGPPPPHPYGAPPQYH